MNDKEIKQLLLSYNKILEKLHNAHIINTSKLVGEYGEYIAAKKLHLQRMLHKGYDAIRD